MQVFGRFATNFGDEFVVQQYLYVPQEKETIDVAQLEELLANKRKTVAGTIFLHNPTIAPVGYNTTASLASQGFIFDDKFHELVFDNASNLFYAALKGGYEGKLIEVKYFFNLNLANIQYLEALDDIFESDLDKFYSNQLTRFDKYLNYQDYLNIRLNGKFVFFAIGAKFEKQFKNIVSYVRNLALQSQKLGKQVAFLHDNTCDEDEAVQSALFLSVLASAKYKDIRANAFKSAFSTNPHSVVRIR
jgi:hypothetical protein